MRESKQDDQQIASGLKRLHFLLLIAAALLTATVLCVFSRRDSSGPPSNEHTDEVFRDRLLARVEQIASRGEGEIAVGLEDFFIGNTDLGSIGANLGHTQPPIQEFHRVLMQVRGRQDVQDVLVRISDHEGLEWPFTDAVWVLTSASASEVREWVKPLLPDEVVSGWVYDRPIDAPDLREGVSPVWVWWD